MIDHNDGTNADLILRRSDIVAAGASFGVIVARALNDTDTELVDYAAIGFLNRSKVDGSEDGQINFEVMEDGTSTDYIQIRGQVSGRGVLIKKNIGFFDTPAVIQPATAGTTTGHVAVGGTNVDASDTFTGNTGTKAYTINDIVLALKQLGLMAAS